jgi:hypothetical protein
VTDSTPSAAGQNRTDDRAPVWEKAFLSKLSKEGNVSAACHAAKISRSTAYERKESDPAFAARWQEALDEAADLLEAEAWRRAFKGVLEPVYQQKEKVGEIRKYSDSLMALLLKAHKPDKYRERTDVTSGGEKVAIAVVKMDTDEL